MYKSIDNFLGVKNKSRNEFKSYTEMDTKSFIFRLENICRDNGLQQNKDGEPTVLNIILELVFYQLISPQKTEDGYDMENYKFQAILEDLLQFDFAEEYYLCNFKVSNWEFYKTKLIERREFVKNKLLDPRITDNDKRNYHLCYGNLLNLKDEDFDKWNDSEKLYYVYTLLIRKYFSDIDFHEAYMMFDSLFYLNDNEFPRKIKTITRTFLSIIEHFQEKTIQYEDLGDIFEYFLSSKQEKKNTSKALGQFFTPIPIVDKVLQETPIQDGDKVLDYACGSGTFLIKSALKHPNITCYGCEIHDMAYRFLLYNHLFKLLKFPDSEKFQKQDAFHFVPRLNEEMDVIVANPPFGIQINILGDNLYEIVNEEQSSSTGRRRKIVKKLEKLPSVVRVPKLELNKKLTERMVTNNECKYYSEGLFLALAISALKEGGHGSIVFSTGILDGDINIFYRKQLLTSCILKKIIHVSAGTFKNTSIATCILFFVKQEPTDDYEIIHEDFTTGEVINKQWASEVLDDQKCEFKIKQNVELVKKDILSDIFTEYKLGDICEFKNGQNITRDNLIEGPYPVYGGGLKPVGKHSNYNYDENNILVSKDGSCGLVQFLQSKSFITGHGYKVININHNILTKFLYYQLKYLQPILSSYKKGEGKGSPRLQIDKVYLLPIKVPSMELQQKLVELFETKYKTEELQKIVMKYFLDGLTFDEINNKMKLVCDFIKQRGSYEFLKKNIQDHMNLTFYEFLNEVECHEYKLGDICDINYGKRILKKDCEKEGGNIPVYGGGDITFYTNTANRSGITCKIARFGVSLKNCVMIINGDYYLHDNGLTITSSNLNVIDYYLWYHLKFISPKILNCCRGKAQLALNIESFKQLSIKVPSILKQEFIVGELDEIASQLSFYDKNIERMNKRINNFVYGDSKFETEYTKIILELNSYPKEDEIMENENEEYDYTDNDEDM